MRQQLQYFWPEEYERLEKGFVNCIPDCPISPVYPHAGFVLNLNVLTAGHRDLSDDFTCILIPFGINLEGGELVVEETGQVFRLKRGDILIFRSRRLTHYNLHYKGMRGSIIIHTDGTAKSWSVDRNGYKLFVQS